MTQTREITKDGIARLVTNSVGGFLRKEIDVQEVLNSPTIGAFCDKYEGGCRGIYAISAIIKIEDAYDLHISDEDAENLIDGNIAQTVKYLSQRIGNR